MERSVKLPHSVAMQHRSSSTTNKVIDVVKVVLREAVICEELDRDPTELVRRVRHKKRERGIFTVEELKRLFPDYGYGPWKDASGQLGIPWLVHDGP